MKYDELTEINQRLAVAQVEYQMHINKLENDCVNEYEISLQLMRIEDWADEIFILKNRKKSIEE